MVDLSALPSLLVSSRRRIGTAGFVGAADAIRVIAHLDDIHAAGFIESERDGIDDVGLGSEDIYVEARINLEGGEVRSGGRKGERGGKSEGGGGAFHGEI